MDYIYVHIFIFHIHIFSYFIYTFLINSTLNVTSKIAKITQCINSSISLSLPPAMGLLSEGNPLSWEETKKLADHVREHGINQFINLYHRLKDRQGDILKWGDEVEYIIVKFDDERKVARVALKAQDLLEKLNEKEAADPKGVKSLWRPEYGAYMIEGTPGKPFGGLMAHFNLVEANMRYRREEVTELLASDECVMSITNFPRLGAPDFTWPLHQPHPEDPLSSARSLYFPDEAIYPGHPRFKTLTRNIRKRRGEKVSIKLKGKLQVQESLESVTSS